MCNLADGSLRTALPGSLPRIRCRLSLTSGVVQDIFLKTIGEFLQFKY